MVYARLSVLLSVTLIVPWTYSLGKFESNYTDSQHGSSLFGALTSTV